MVSKDLQVVMKDLATPEGLETIAKTWSKEFGDHYLWNTQIITENGNQLLAVTLRRKNP